MIPELELLYRQAIKSDNLTRWLRDRDIIKSYEDSVRFSDADRARLLEILTDDSLDIFRRYIDNQAEQEDAESQMLFCQGLSMGLRLGSLCVSV